MRKRLIAVIALAVIAVLGFGSVALATGGEGTAASRVKLELSTQADSTSQPVANGTYLVQSKLSKWQVLDVASASKADFGNVQIYKSNMTGAQQWKFTYVKKAGYYTIQNVNSKKYLDVSNGQAKSGTNVQQYTKNGTNSQYWKITKNSDGTLSITSALSDKLALTVAGGKKVSGTNVQIATAGTSNAQKWKVISTNVNVPKGQNLNLTGWYQIKPAAAQGYTLDIANASTADGTNVQIYTGNSTLAQYFRFEYKNGYYRIISACANKSLGAESGNLIPGTNVSLTSSTGASQLFAASKNDDGTVSFINKADGLALALSGQAKDGANIVVNTAKTTITDQRFKLVKVKNFMPTGIVTISPVYTKRVLDIAEGSTVADANVQLYDSNSTLAQKWYVTRTAQDTYRIRSLLSGMYLGLDGTNVIVAKKATDGSQEWTADIANGGYVLINKKNDKALDIDGAGDWNGVNVQTYTKNGSKAQSFTLSSTVPVSNGTYLINSSLGSSQVLDVTNGSTADKANVQTYARNMSGAQKWNITRNSDGTYTIVNVQSGKALDVLNASKKSGANVQQYKKNNTTAQKWNITYDGTFKITSALDSSLVLSVAGGKAKSGSNVDIETKSTSKAQKWTLTPTSSVSPEQQAMMNRAKGYDSATEWLILVDCTKNKTCIFKGSKNNWAVQYFWTCSTGAPSTPTVKGEFTIYDRYDSFGETYTCWWPTRFYGAYLFHSVLYEPGSKTEIQDGRLGQNVSQGCVRLPIDQAQWIHDNIPNGTKVVVY